MVIIAHGFEVRLVTASTKVPFLEHTRDGKTYFEVEPDVEYYIAIRRLAMPGGGSDHFCRCFVDGHGLGVNLHLRCRDVDSNWTYTGILKYDKDGQMLFQNLRFVVPRASAGASSPEAELGSVVLEICESHPCEEVQHTSPMASTEFQPPQVQGISQDALARKKCLRSAEGAGFSLAFPCIDFHPGPSIFRWQGNYGTAAALVRAEVLERPETRPQLSPEIIDLTEEVDASFVGTEISGLTTTVSAA
jgi:hypothetical protein